MAAGRVMEEIEEREKASAPSTVTRSWSVTDRTRLELKAFECT